MSPSRRPAAPQETPTGERPLFCQSNHLDLTRDQPDVCLGKKDGNCSKVHSFIILSPRTEKGEALYFKKVTGSPCWPIPTPLEALFAPAPIFSLYRHTSPSSSALIPALQKLEALLHAVQKLGCQSGAAQGGRRALHYCPLILPSETLCRTAHLLSHSANALLLRESTQGCNFGFHRATANFPGQQHSI